MFILDFMNKLIDKLQSLLTRIHPLDVFCQKVVGHVLKVLYENSDMVTYFIYLVILFIILKKKVIPFIRKFIFTETTDKSKMEEVITPKTTRKLDKTKVLILIFVIFAVMYFLAELILSI